MIISRMIKLNYKFIFKENQFVEPKTNHGVVKLSSAFTNQTRPSQITNNHLIKKKGKAKNY